MYNFVQKGATAQEGTIDTCIGSKNCAAKTSALVSNSNENNYPKHIDTTPRLSKPKSALELALIYTLVRSDIIGFHPSVFSGYKNQAEKKRVWLTI